MTINEYIGSRIRELREKKGLSIRSAAAEIGMNWSTLHNYEDGRRSIPLDALNRIARYYNASAGEILSDTLDLMNKDELEDA